MNPVDVEFLVQDEDDLVLLEKALEDAEALDVERVTDSGFVEVVGIVVAAVVALSGLANVLMKLARSRSRGVIVDARGAVIRTSTTADLPSGTVLVLTPDGVRQELHEVTEIDLARLVAPSS